MTQGQIAAEVYNRMIASGQSVESAWEAVALTIAASNMVGQTPFGQMRPDSGVRAATLLEVLSDPAKFAGDMNKDPVWQMAPNRGTLMQFFDDHSTGDGTGFNPPHPAPGTGESINNVSHDTNSPVAGLTMAEFYRGAPQTALLWWRWTLMQPQNGGKDPGDEFMQAFLAKLAPSQKKAMGKAA